jgi:hypothetical protein
VSRLPPTRSAITPSRSSAGALNRSEEGLLFLVGEHSDIRDSYTG